MATKSIRKLAEVVSRQRSAINSIRNDLEALPIAVAEGVFQCDERSLTRMRLTLECWGATTLTVNEAGQQMWPDVDNAIRLFSEAEFSDFFSRIKVALAARADRLYVLAAEQKSMLPLDEGHLIFDINSELWQGVL